MEEQEKEQKVRLHMCLSLSLIHPKKDVVLTLEMGFFSSIGELNDRNLGLGDKGQSSSRAGAPLFLRTLRPLVKYKSTVRNSFVGDTVSTVWNWAPSNFR